MGAVGDYAFLHGRVSVLASQLLPPERIEPLIDDPDADHADYFTAAGLGPLLESPPADARELEQLLADVIIDEALRLGRGLRSGARDLVHQFVRRFEMVNLKILIRCKLAGCSPEQIRERLFTLGALPCGNTEALLQAEDINELLRQLEAGRHGLLARQLRQVLAESQEVFLIEAAVDYGYFSELYRLVSALPIGDRQNVQPFIARIIDQMNLVWLMRYRVGYGMTPPHAFFLLIRVGGQLGRQRLAALAQLDSLEAMIEALPPTMAQIVDGAGTINEVEERFNAQRLHLAANALHHSTFSLVRAIGYLMLREQQMRNVHEVIKGRMLALPPALVRRALGLTPTQEAA